MTLFSIVLLSPLSWAGIGAPLGNHLWQSTVFAGAVWLLTLLLRKNSAQSRYVLWLVASAKFLLPFSLLIALGSHIAWTKAPSTPPSLFVMTQLLSEPFDTGNLAPVAHASDTLLAALLRALPTLLFIVWSVGCVFVLFMWYLRWRHLTAARRAAPPSNSGRELEVLRRIERSARFPRQIDLLLSKSGLEPGILGILRPALLLPAGISEELTDAQLESVIAHELCHVRRCDNLAAGLHMLVEALFWFHPLVWWMGARLVEERERACDEEVLSLGTDPHVYAESILKVCKFYLESPLFCAAGVTGSNLKKRIEAIMRNRIAPKLDLGKKLLLSTLGVTALVGPIAFGLLHVPQSRAQAQSQNAPMIAPAFETASINPNTTGEPMAGLTSVLHSLELANGVRDSVKGPMQAIIFRFDKFLAANYTLKGLIRAAYGVQNSQITGGPDWLDSEKFDVNATIGSSLMHELSKLSTEEAGQEKLRMLQNLLADRFKLALHRETKGAPAYVLAVAKDGPKLQQAKAGDTYPDGLKDPLKGRPLGPGVWLPGPCKVVGQGVPITSLVRILSQELNRVVVDKTNLQGNYDFTLDCHTAFMERGESILTVLPEQLGLELSEQALPVEMLVIDHVEQPASNESGRTQQDQNVAESVAANMPPARVYDDVSIYKSAPNSMPTSDFSPDGFTATNVTLQNLIQWAYDVEGFQIYGAPNWLDRERYDLKANVGSSLANDMRNLTKEQLRFKQQPMLLELLADLFKLEVHRDTRELPAYNLVVAGTGAKLEPAPAGELPQMRAQMRFGRVLIAGQSMPIGLAENGRPGLVQMLSHDLQRPVLDKTGLKGVYDFSLEWTPDASLGVEHGPSLFAAIQEQLGLTLLLSNEQTARVEVLVIDHAEQLTGNEHWDAARLNASR